MTYIYCVRTRLIGQNNDWKICLRTNMHWILPKWNRSRIVKSLTCRQRRKSRRILRLQPQNLDQTSVIHYKLSHTLPIYILLYLTLTMCLDSSEGFPRQRSKRHSGDMMMNIMGMSLRDLTIGSHPSSIRGPFDQKTDAISQFDFTSDDDDERMILARIISAKPFHSTRTSSSATNANTNHLLAPETRTPFAAKPQRIRRTVGDRRITKLYCRTGFTLRIRPNGRVDGTYDNDSPLVVMEIQSVGKGGLVRIQSRATGKFLAMKPSGKLYAADSYDPDRSTFFERIVSWYNTYALRRSPSHKRRKPMYVAISKGGRAKKGSKVPQTSKSAHFLPIRT